MNNQFSENSAISIIGRVLLQRLDAPEPRLMDEERGIVDSERRQITLCNAARDADLRGEKYSPYDAALPAESIRSSLLAIIDRLSAQPKETLPMLLGSNVQPALIKVGVREIQLGEFVRFAAKRGKFTTEQWNSLPDDEREARIRKAIHWYQMVEAEPGGIMAGNPNGPMGAVIRAELARQTAASEQPKETGKVDAGYALVPEYDPTRGGLHPAPSATFDAMIKAYDAASQKHGRIETMMAVYNAAVRTAKDPHADDAEDGARATALRMRQAIVSPEKAEGETP